VTFNKSMHVWLLAIFLTLIPGVGLAQFENGSLIGTIRDASGAVIAGAQVIIVNTGTGISVSKTTDKDGDYELPSVHIGTYTISATHEGFNKAIAENISISVNTRQRVDLTLHVGTVGETVEVTNVQLALETESSQRGQIITQYQTEAFPLPTLNYSDLVGLATGVTVSPIGTNNGNQSLVREGSFNVSGQRSMFNNYILDGVDNNAHGTSNQGFSNQIMQPAPTSVAEFQVVTNNSSAEYGRASGATINVAFASGTNKFHGQVYEYFRNTVLNGGGYFPGNAGKPKTNRNQYGANIGGPIMRNRAFFFADYEGFRQSRSNVNYSNVPSLFDHSYSFTQAVHNPFTGKNYAKDVTSVRYIVPEADLSPIAVKIMKAYPVPNVPGVVDGVLTNNYVFTQKFSDNSEKYDGKVDFQIDPRTSSFLRLSQMKELAVDGVLIPLPFDGGSNGNQKIMNQQAVLGVTRQLRSSQLLEMRLGVSYTKGAKSTLSVGQPVFAPIPGLVTDSRIAGGLPTFAVSGYTTFGRQPTNPQWQYPFMLNPKLSYAFSVGRHSLKAGVEYQHIRVIDQDVNPIYGRFTYNAGTSSSTCFSCNNMLDFLFGATAKYEQTSFFVAHLRQNMYFGYLQDDWKISNRLTLNLGMRYEYGSRFSDKDNLLTNFDPVTTPVTGKMLSASSGGVYNRTLIDPDLNDFAPRLGFAFAATPTTVLHGGYGVSFVHTNRDGENDVLAVNAPQTIFGLVQQVPAKPKGTAIKPTANYRTLDQGFAPDFTSNFNIATTTITYVPRNYRDAYVQSYYLSVQRQLGANRILDIAYVGNHSLKLMNIGNFNQRNVNMGRGADGLFIRPYPAVGDIIYTYPGGYGNYNGLQVRYEQRKVHGLTVLNSFTYSRAFDNAAGNLENSFGNNPGPQDLYNTRADYGPSEYDKPLVDVLSLIYQLPFGRGKMFAANNHVVNTAISGWQVSMINTMRSGQAFTPIYTPATADTVSGITSSNNGANNYRPNRAPGIPLITKGDSGGFPTRITAGVFSTPTAGGASPFGNASRNLMRADPYYTLDATLQKTFLLPFENLSMQFRAQGYNILNKTNFQPPGTTCCGASFGQISSAYAPRNMQFALKLIY